LTAAYIVGWFGMFLAGLMYVSLPQWVLWTGFSLSLPLGLAWLAWSRSRPRLMQFAFASLITSSGGTGFGVRQ